MPTAAERGPELLVDTSVAVALVVADHEHHVVVTAAIGRRRVGLAGHAAFETFSVLTRLPGPARRAPDVISELLLARFPESRFLDSAATVELLAQLARLRIAGGAVYDALVGATAAAHRLPLATRDRRALDVYQRLGAEVEVID
jgi:predicted nucleic acid-binding protein